MKNQKVAYVIRIQGWAAECAEEPLDHGKRMSKFWTYAEVKHA